MKRLIVVLSASIAIAQCVSAKSDKPNIIFFLIDDMGWKDLGCYGGNFIETPVADKLAADGIRFTNAYASPVCSPTRASLVTGQNAARTGIWEVIGVQDRPFAKMKSPPKSEQIKEGIK
ncbi:MAG: sulfatase-like hydrolase/transferase, partial [Pedobacter sp.]